MVNRLLSVLSLLPGLAAAATPWTTSHVEGTPEPPKPFIAEPQFAKVALENVLDLVAVPGLKQWLAVQNNGQIIALPNDPQCGPESATVALDLKAKYPACDHAYGVAFHPLFGKNREVFITYTNGDKLDDGSRLSRFKVVQDNPLKIDPASEEIIITWLSGGHNGAAIAFGPDGMLYLSTGDAEVPAPPDPRVTGQDISDLLSSILRLDVDHRDTGKAYAVPADNPFLKTPGARPEIWCYGLRNPWKISFDPANGRLWCGDVGWEQWEQIFLIQRGGNYGWSAMEGNNPILPERKAGPSPITPPVVSHHHSEAASITGGFVYHGKQLPELEGAYLYADYETGKVWALWHDGTQVTRHEEIADTAFKIVTFGRGEDGELLLAHYGVPATIHRLVRNPNAGKQSHFPRKLSETGLFSDVAKQTPEAGVYPFAIRAPMWSDGAQGSRFIGIPQGAGSVETKVWTNKKTSKTESKVTWPAGTVLAKTLSMALDQAKPDATTKVETQLLHYDGVAWNAYSYRWNDAGTDAELVADSGDERTMQLKGDKLPGGTHRYAWRFHSRGECLRCHTNWSGFANSFQPQQLVEEQPWVERGLVDTDYFKQSAERLVNPHDKTQKLDVRARSWLHANCAHCHRQNGGGSVALMLNAEMSLDEMRALKERPLRGDFGMSDAQIIMPGNPWKSALLHRISTTGSGHMPVIGSHEVDVGGAQMLAEWINDMGKTGVMNLVSADPYHKPESALCLALMHHRVGSDYLLALARDQAPPKEAPGPNTGEDVQAPMSLTWDITVPRTAATAAHIHGLLERLLPDNERIITLGSSVSVAKVLAGQGDAKRGAELLTPTGKAAACLGCHFINGNGRDFGPDLSKVGARLTREQIAESMVQPGKVIAQGFTPMMISFNDGSAQTGFIVTDESGARRLKIATGQTLALPKEAVKAEQTLPASLMPEGLLQSFTAQEAADLMAYLSSLK